MRPDDAIERARNAIGTVGDVKTQSALSSVLTAIQQVTEHVRR